MDDDSCLFQLRVALVQVQSYFFFFYYFRSLIHCDFRGIHLEDEDWLKMSPQRVLVGRNDEIDITSSAHLKWLHFELCPRNTFPGIKSIKIRESGSSTKFTIKFITYNHPPPPSSSHGMGVSSTFHAFTTHKIDRTLHLSLLPWFDSIPTHQFIDHSRRGFPISNHDARI